MNYRTSSKVIWTARAFLVTAILSLDLMAATQIREYPPRGMPLRRHERSERNEHATRNLISGVAMNDIEKAWQALFQGADENAATHQGTPMIHLAILQDRKDILELLLKYGADPNKTDPNWGTPLLFAIYHGKDDMVSWLLESGADPDMQHKERHPLMTAVERNDTVALDLLASHDIDLSNKKRLDSALIDAINWRKTEAADWLLDHGSNPNCIDKEGWTPLVWAAHEGNQQIGERLIAMGAKEDVFTAAGLGQVETLKKILKGNRAAVFQRKPGEIEGFARIGEPKPWSFQLRQISKSKGLKNTPLHWAARNGQLECARILLDAGADVNAEGTSNRTPILMVRSVEVAELLLNRGADINARDIHGATRLYGAARVQNVPMVKLLLERGIDVNLKGPYGHTALHKAAFFNCPEIIGLLLEKEALLEAKDDTGMTPLHLAALGTAPDAVRFLIEHKANVNAVDSENWTPLHMACGVVSLKRNYAPETRQITPEDFSKLDEIIKMLRDNGAVVDFYLACALGERDKVERLLKARPDVVNNRNKQGETPLHWAAMRGQRSIAELLLANGADLNAKDGNDRTALLCAQSAKQKDMAWFISHYGKHE